MFRLGKVAGQKVVLLYCLGTLADRVEEMKFGAGNFEMDGRVRCQSSCQTHQ